jgi:hypothetical protein
MNLQIDPSLVEKAPSKPRIPAGVAAAAALAGEPDALADWVLSSLKGKALREFKGDEAKASALVKELVSNCVISVEFVDG